MAKKMRQVQIREDQLRDLYEILKTEKDEAKREQILAQIFEIEESLNNL